MRAKKDRKDMVKKMQRYKVGGMEGGSSSTNYHVSR